VVCAPRCTKLSPRPEYSPVKVAVLELVIYRGLMGCVGPVAWCSLAARVAGQGAGARTTDRSAKKSLIS
jgi:hypothetical protein